MTAESERLGGDRDLWLRWGPYLAERAWGTVREDYTAASDPWLAFPHDHARSRAYRWNEDGLGGVCDDQQRLCFAFGFWNGHDPILKERIFGLSGHEGNHGEDPKELWWFLDATPSGSWLRWRYLYPQVEFPYDELVSKNARRNRQVPEFELSDTAALAEDRWWEVTVDYAKAAPEDLCIRVSVRNAGPEPARLDVLPTLWFRNTWSWGIDDRRPSVRVEAGAVVADHHSLGRMVLAGGGEPELLFCDNETNATRLWNGTSPTGFPKDGIGEHVITGAPTVNLAQAGTKAALGYRLEVPAGATSELRLRLSRAGSGIDDGWASAMAARSAEADDFHDALRGSLPDPEAKILRQALAGMVWSKQFFHYDVERWLDGDPAGPVPPPPRLTGRNAAWRHLNNHDVISMPDTWEYPWFAAWDLAFHCLPLAHLDATFAKQQLLLLCREWYMHPNGQLPAYEWAFGDVNPPVHGWAALRVSEIDTAATGARDYDFLERVLHKLVINFTWWVNRKDQEGNNLFEGGFLGMDNIGPFDRSAPLPPGCRLDQADATGWMAMYCLNLLEISMILAEHDDTYEDLATKFLEHFAQIATAINDRGLWDDTDGYYYDTLVFGQERRPLRIRSMVGVVPLCASMTIGQATLDRLPGFRARLEWFLRNKPHLAANLAQSQVRDGTEERLLSVVTPERLTRLLGRVLDEDELLAPYGLRSLSKAHRDQPFVLDFAGETGAVSYEPGESSTGAFGGNSNWRGPVWFPVNYLVIEALRRFAGYLGPGFRVEHPTRSGRQATLSDVADDLGARLISLFLPDGDGRRPIFGDGPQWGDLLFHEYFHADTGQGLGASHQTGWTGLVADLLIHRRDAARPRDPDGRLSG